MKKTILADVDGFTPIIDELAREYGLVRAAVFGRMWRYCQMSDGVCRASLETISTDLAVDRATVMRHAQALVEDGYLKDTTPDLRNRPHIYRDTGKAGIRISIGVAHSNSHSETVAESNTTVAQSNTGVAESQLKKVLKKEIKKEELGADKPHREPTDEQKELAHLETLFCELTGHSAPARKTDKERKAAAEMWWQPLRHIRDQANGQSDKVLKLAVQKMRKDNLTIYSPKSVEKTAIALLAELPRTFQTAAPADPYASLRKYMHEKNK